MNNAGESLVDPAGGAYDAPPDPLVGLRPPGARAPPNFQRG